MVREGFFHTNCISVVHAAQPSVPSADLKLAFRKGESRSQSDTALAEAYMQGECAMPIGLGVRRVYDMYMPS